LRDKKNRFRLFAFGFALALGGLVIASIGMMPGLVLLGQLEKYWQPLA
jgi:hypothetical protein